MGAPAGNIWGFGPTPNPINLKNNFRVFYKKIFIGISKTYPLALLEIQVVGNEYLPVFQHT